MSANQNSGLKKVLRSSRAYKSFRLAAWCLVPLALILLIAITPIYDTITSYRPLQIVFQVSSACIGIFGAVAGIVIFVGMLAYLFLLDRSPWKLLWLIVFLFTGCFGSGIYFFTVYRKQVAPPLRLA